MDNIRLKALNVMLSLLVVSILLGPQPSYAQPPRVLPGRSVLDPMEPGKNKMGADIIRVLRDSGEAMIVIALNDPSSPDISRHGLSRLKREVSRMQEAVLASMDASDFVVVNRYQAVPALSGRLLSEAGWAKLAANPYVTRVDLDAGGTGSLGVSVPLIGANTWHNVGNAGQGVVVAVLDSGVDTDHADLGSAIIHEACFLDADGSINGVGLCPNGSDRQVGPGAAEDDAGHGTHVAGIVASRGNRSSPGAAPGASIVAIKVTAGPSFVGIFYLFSEVVAALDYIINYRSDVKIVNMSLVTNAQFVGNCDNTTSWNMAGASAINTLRSMGIVSFASSGNRGGNLMSSPACLSNVVSVGATDNSDNVASFTDSNSTTDLLAPGVGIVSSGMGNITVTASGTSMAAPHAAGCAALMVAAGEATTPDAIEARLKASTPRVYNPRNGLTFARIECSVKPLTGVQLNGPTTGTVGVPYGYVAVITPMSATQPISYFWVPPPLQGQGTSTATYSWSAQGVFTIAVTAINAANAPKSDTLTVTVQAVPTDEYRIYLPWISRQRP